MSKKNKAKFKKLIKKQMLQELARTQGDNDLKAQSVSEPIMSSSEPAAAVAINSSEINLPQIKYDLKKTGIIVFSLAIIMATIYFLDLKYNILLTFGDWLFKVLHIN